MSRSLVRSDGGQSLVELALSLGVLVFLLIGGADMARAHAAQVGVLNAARAGAEAWVTKKATTDAAVTAYAQDELSRVAGVDLASAAVLITHSSALGVNLIEVRVQYTFRTLVPWPGIPNVLPLDRALVMREF